jgi:glycosyltransferase involved in cell wall biosynthesis
MPLTIIYGAQLYTLNEIEYLTKINEKFAFNVNRYHKLIIEGLSLHCKITVFSFKNKNIKQNSLSSFSDYEDLSIPFRNFTLFLKSMIMITRRLSERNTIIVADVLQLKHSFLLYLLSRIYQTKFVSIVTDRPEDIFVNSSIRLGLSNYLISKSEGYIFVTSAMDNIYNNKYRRPFIVINTVVEDLIIKLDYQKYYHNNHIVGYAGHISEENNVHILVDAIKKIPQFKLYLFGNISKEFENDFFSSIIDSNISYFGILEEKQLFSELRNCRFLINTRNLNMQYTLYTYPIKTSFYLSTGVPLISTELKGIPVDHFDFIFKINFENSEELSRQLLYYFDLSPQDTYDLGRKGQEFVNNMYSSKFISKKIFNFITELHHDK